MPKKKYDTELPTDSELLIELGTLDDIEAYIPTAKDHQHGITPQWCELVLKISRLRDPHVDEGPGDWPLNVTLPIRRHDGELIIQVLHDVLHPKEGGTSALESAWDRMDAVVRRIQKRVEKGKSPRLLDIGEARGLATAIALMISPLQPDEEVVRELAMERYEIVYGDATESVVAES